jgi:hypothetical protein
MSGPLRTDFTNAYLCGLTILIFGVLCLLEGSTYPTRAWPLLPLGLASVILSYIFFKWVLRDLRP